jgi:hypothetical protein
VVAFLALGYLAIIQFLQRNWLISFVVGSGAWMCIPFADHSAPVRERFVGSLVAPFAMGGLACFVLLYFQMFRFAWFEAVFNNDGTGPIGLIFSAITGLGAGGFIGWRVLSYAGWTPTLNSRAADDRSAAGR